MNKLLAIIVASTFALSSASGFAADTATKQELTKEERMEMRARADKLTSERAANPGATNAEHATKVKKHHVAKPKNVSTHHANAHHKA